MSGFLPIFHTALFKVLMLRMVQLIALSRLHHGKVSTITICGAIEIAVLIEE